MDSMFIDVLLMKSHFVSLDACGPQHILGRSISNHNHLKFFVYKYTISIEAPELKDPHTVYHQRSTRMVKLAVYGSCNIGSIVIGDTLTSNHILGNFSDRH